MYSMVRVFGKERTNKALTVSKDVISLGKTALLVSPVKSKKVDYVVFYILHNADRKIELKLLILSLVTITFCTLKFFT